MILDSQRLTDARHAVGLTRTELANRCGISGRAVRGLESGSDPELSLRQLHRLAEALHLPIAALFAEEADVVSDQQDDVDDDAAVLCAALWRQPQPLAVRALVEALGWDAARLRAAQGTARKRLAPAGLLLRRLHGELAILPRPELNAAARATEAGAVAAIGLDLLDYRLAYRVLISNRPVHFPQRFRGRVSMGRLGRHRVLERDGQQHRLTDDASFSLMLAEEPGGSPPRETAEATS